MRFRDLVWTGMVVAGCLPGLAGAQTVGTFRWHRELRTRLEQLERLLDRR